MSYQVKKITHKQVEFVDAKGEKEKEEWFLASLKNEDTGETIAIKSDSAFGFNVGDILTLSVKSKQMALVEAK
jgi:hypothetical protein